MIVNKIVIVVGNSRSGKTSIVHQLTRKNLDEVYKETYCCDFFIKEMTFCHELVKLNIWDTFGQELVSNSLPNKIYRQASGFFIVCSFDDHQALETLESWYNHIHELSNMEPNIPILVIANKKDLKQNQMAFSPRDIKDVCNKLNIPVFQISALRNVNEVDIMFYKMTEYMLGRSNTFRKSSIITEDTRISLNKYTPTNVPSLSIKLDRDKKCC